MTLHVRFATADDVPLIADFIQMAGAGVFEQLLNGVLPHIKAADILPLAVTEETSPLYFDNAVLAWEGGRTLGCMVGYPAVEYGLPPVIRTMVPKRRLAPLRELLESRLEDTFYVNTLAVSEEARGRGIARILLETAAGVALERGFSALSLHAWSDYERAMAVYQSFGFDPVREITVASSKYLHHKGPIVLMRASLPGRGHETAMA